MKSQIISKSNLTHARALLTFHHILSTQKKRTIRQAAREIEVCGVCKVGYPGVLAVEGKEESVSRYVRKIKSLRWASCTQANFTSGLKETDLKMKKASLASNEGGMEMMMMFEKMSEVGAYMRQVGLEDWWRKSMGYQKGDSS